MEKTIKNLARAFIGESQARNRYTFYSKIAKKEGLEQIAGVFALTAEQEKEHANWLFKMINELKGKSKKWEEIVVEATAPTIRGNTAQNLQAAIDGENYEHTEMYPEFARVAEKEGLFKVAARLRSIAVAESHHEERYKKLLKSLKNGTVFERNKKVWWACRECGYVHFGKNAPKVCPSCDHPQAYYEIKT